MEDKEYEIIKKVIDGDQEASKEILEAFELLIYSIINKYELGNGDYIVSKEDLFQEGCIALFQACKTYKKNDVTRFSTYAYIVIERRIKKAFYKMVKPYRKECSYDKYEHEDHLKFLETKSISDNPIKYLEDEGYLKGEFKYLSKEDKEIIKLRFQNYSYKEIAKTLNITTKRVDNRLTRIKKYRFRIKQRQ